MWGCDGKFKNDEQLTQTHDTQHFFIYHSSLPSHFVRPTLNKAPISTHTDLPFCYHTHRTLYAFFNTIALDHFRIQKRRLGVVLGCVIVKSKIPAVTTTLHCLCRYAFKTLSPLNYILTFFNCQAHRRIFGPFVGSELKKNITVKSSCLTLSSTNSSKWARID